MNDKLRALVERIAEIEALITEWDEWFNNYISFVTKRDLVRKFGTTDELKDYIDQLDNRAQEALEIAQGAEKEIASKLNMDVEGARILTTQLRTIMHKILTTVSEEAQEDLEGLSRDQLVDSAFKLLGGK